MGAATSNKLRGRQSGPCSDSAVLCVPVLLPIGRRVKISAGPLQVPDLDDPIHLPDVLEIAIVVLSRGCNR